MVRIIFADDSPIVRDQLFGMLTRLGHEVIGRATDGGEVLPLCDKDLPDIVILDVVMLKMNGDIVAQALRAKYPTLPLVLMTAQANLNTHNTANSCKASIYHKPIDPHAITSIEVALRTAVDIVA